MLQAIALVWENVLCRVDSEDNHALALPVWQYAVAFRTIALHRAMLGESSGNGLHRGISIRERLMNTLATLTL